MSYKKHDHNDVLFSISRRVCAQVLSSRKRLINVSSFCKSVLVTSVYIIRNVATSLVINGVFVFFPKLTNAR